MASIDVMCLIFFSLGACHKLIRHRKAGSVGSASLNGELLTVSKCLKGLGPSQAESWASSQPRPFFDKLIAGRHGKAPFPATFPWGLFSSNMVGSLGVHMMIRDFFGPN